MPTYLGEFEELVLLAICGLESAYAVAIQQCIEHKGQRATTIGNVYRTLSRLEEKGYIRSWMGEVTRTRGGKRKRLYEITGQGQEAIVAMRQTRERMWEGVSLKPAMTFS